MNKKEEDKYCRLCGSKMDIVRVPNEQPFWVIGYTGYSYDRAGEKYSEKNGKKMYREEYHCPTKETTGFFCKKQKAT